MGRIIALVAVLFAFAACGSSSKHSSDLQQSGSDGNVTKDTGGIEDTSGTIDQLGAQDGVSADIVDDGSSPSDVDAPDDTSAGEDVPLVFPDSVSPIAGCVTSCGGSSCGAGICYVCTAENQCVDVSQSLWDIGSWNQAVWGP